jgi:DNA-binding transcriptional MerR regulator
MVSYPPAGTIRAVYDDSHVRRLRLIRALVGSGGLSLARVHEVLATLDEPAAGTHSVLGSAQYGLGPAIPEPTDASRRRVDDLLGRLGWKVYADAPARAAALDALDAVDNELPDDLLDTYADSVGRIGKAEVSSLPDDPAEALERAVVVTVLGEPVLLALRRLAQENASAERYRP